MRIEGNILQTQGESGQVRGFSGHAVPLNPFFRITKARRETGGLFCLMLIIRIKRINTNWFNNRECLLKKRNQGDMIE